MDIDFPADGDNLRVLHPGNAGKIGKVYAAFCFEFGDAALFGHNLLLILAVFFGGGGEVTVSPQIEQ